MINTYNESKLHRTLKELYALNCSGRTEVPVEGSICDVLSPDGTVTEIQTGNLSKLLPKIMKLKEKHNVHVVYPLVTETRIHLYDKNGTLISNRKSPKKRRMIDIFNELMGIYPILDQEWFTLEVVPVSCIETRIRTEQPVQLNNNSRRFRKNWYRKDKELASMEKSLIFRGLQSYLSLLPAEFLTKRDGEPFCAKDLERAGCGKLAHKILWVLKKTEAVCFIEKKGRTSYYAFRKDHQLSESHLS